VEFLDSPNEPLPIPDSMRLHPPGGEGHRMAS
jgi:hypothetical protein